MNLILNNIKKTYYNDKDSFNAIKNISFNLLDGEIISVVGKSGCGKSTLLNIISGLDKQTGGEIIFDTKDPKISYMFQQDALLPYKNVLDNACLGFELIHNKNEKEIEKVKNMLIEYGLKDFMYLKPNKLSGGMKQRVALIRSLAINPDLLLLDEPFSALDYYTRIKICEDVYKILKKNKVSTILITHDIGEAISISDKVVVLSSSPSIVKNIYKVELDNNLSIIDKRNSQKFNELYKQIWSDLNEE